MKQNFEDFSPEAILQLARSPAGQQLMALLQSEHQGAMDTVRQNPKDVAGARSALAGFLADPRAQALLQQLQEDSHG